MTIFAFDPERTTNARLMADVHAMSWPPPTGPRYWPHWIQVRGSWPRRILESGRMSTDEPTWIAMMVARGEKIRWVAMGRTR